MRELFFRFIEWFYLFLEKKIDRRVFSFFTVFVLLLIVLTVISFYYHVYFFFILVNILFFSFLLLIIFFIIVFFKKGRFRKEKFSHLHLHLVILFCVFSIIPVVLLSIFSSLVLNQGVNLWFSERIKVALTEADTIVEAYKKENEEVLKKQVENISNKISKNIMTFYQSKESFNHFLDREIEENNIQQAIVFDENSNSWGQSYLSFSLQLDEISPKDLSNAKNKVILIKRQDNKIRALTLIDPRYQVYLYVGKNLDEKLLSRIYKTKKAVAEYNLLLNGEHSLRTKYFYLIFCIFSFFIVMLSIYFGITFATQLSRPITSLINASNKVRKGELKIKVDLPSQRDFYVLTDSFNKMTKKINEQRETLLQVNYQNEEKRKLLEGIFKQVSSGILYLNKQYEILLINDQVKLILNNDDIMNNTSFFDLFYEKEVKQNFNFSVSEKYKEFQVINKKLSKTILFKVYKEDNFEKNDLHYIVTIDDISYIQQEQRLKAWQDIARRIAHEIKNPLTPILLSAERIKRKYSDQIKDQHNIFIRCIETIITQVRYIGEMINEFSLFAKMPQANKKKENLYSLCSQVVTLHQQIEDNIKIDLVSESKEISLSCDQSQIISVLTNLIKNSMESINGISQKDGEIFIKLSYFTNKIELLVEDNGPGFPIDKIDQLLDPYITFKKNGTGLGLAICKKIIEEHNGRIILESKKKGAIVKIIFLIVDESKI